LSGADYKQIELLAVVHLHWLFSALKY